MDVFGLLWFALILKHQVCDFENQPPFMWMNKGTYGHAGGLLHSGYHALATFLLFWVIVPQFWYVSILFALVEFMIHYHMDWFKMNLNRSRGWACNTHEEFWVWLGRDQTVHLLTYWFIIEIWFKPFAYMMGY